MSAGIPQAALGAPDIDMRWGMRIPLRDSIELNSILYARADERGPSPVIVTLTPYVAQSCHDTAIQFAKRGHKFLVIDVRGRGNSDGDFKPNFNEAFDGYDVVEWVAQQPFCDGRVAMWGGSYGGFAQWATASKQPPHLSTIVPVASPCMGVDFPIVGNIAGTYLMQWLTLVWGRTAQDRIFWSNREFWAEKFARTFKAGLAFSQLDSVLGNPSPTFQEWLAHPTLDEYWDSYNPTPQEYARVCIPVLTITGACDSGQLGALHHYRQHIKHAPPEAGARHYLIIGPWDHAGTRAPQLHFEGIEVGPASLLDLRQLHHDWYNWILGLGPKPQFLANRVAYYVIGADKWRYAETLEAITSHSLDLFLSSSTNPTDIYNSGTLCEETPIESPPDEYVYDPRDVSLADIEVSVQSGDRKDQRLAHASAGKQLVYHSAPFEGDLEIGGFFALSAWLSIDQPDTDFVASIYEVGGDGLSTLLGQCAIRARFRGSLRREELVTTSTPLLYVFDRFPFVSRLMRKGGRLRLILGPNNSIYSQKNYNSGGIVYEETMADARAVTVRLFHCRERPSVLHVPVARTSD